MPRQLSSIEFEAHLAQLSVAGVRVLKNTFISAVANADTTYTVTEQVTRRVVVATEAVDGEIRVAVDEASTANKFPLRQWVPLVVDMEKGDVLHAFNTNATTAKDVYILEIA